MNRLMKSLAAAGALAAATLFGAQDVFAGWGSWGSYGGSAGMSYGSWGSYGGGSYGGGYAGGSYGSHRGWGHHVGPIRRLLHHHRRYAGYGSSGGWGSSGGYGSSGGWGSSGGSYYGNGSSGGYGSSGGTYYYGPADDKGTVPLDVDPMGDEVPPEAPMNENDLPGPGAEGNATGSAMLNVTVPEVAKVYVNGRPTSSIGAQRQYVSRGLANGFSYTYEIRAEAVIDGKKVEDVKTVRLQAGDNVDLAFDLKARPETSLTLRVPEDAKVALAGNETAATGAVRVFRTTSLAEGQEWANYHITVTVNRDGETLTKEETIALKAGDSRELSFDFDAAKVASAR